MDSLILDYSVKQVKHRINSFNEQLQFKGKRKLTSLILYPILYVAIFMWIYLIYVLKLSDLTDFTSTKSIKK